MSTASRALQVGDWATTDYNGADRIARVQITARANGGACQSGIMFQVSPPLDRREPDDWYDADWFEPEPKRCR